MMRKIKYFLKRTKLLIFGITLTIVGRIIYAIGVTIEFVAKKIKSFHRNYCDLVPIILYFTFGLLFSLIGIVLMVNGIMNSNSAIFCTGGFSLFVGIEFFYYIIKKHKEN